MKSDKLFGTLNILQGENTCFIQGADQRLAAGQNTLAEVTWICVPSCSSLSKAAAQGKVQKTRKTVEKTSEKMSELCPANNVCSDKLQGAQQ